jgi:hypothetical protein
MTKPATPSRPQSPGYSNSLAVFDGQHKGISGVNLKARVGEISGQADRKTKVQLKSIVLEVTHTDSPCQVTLQGPALSASTGVHNPDESVGAHVSAGASLATAEGTLSFNTGDSVTVGVGVGIGLDVSIGLRDQDQDGDSEVCVRGGIKVITVGICVDGLLPKGLLKPASSQTTLKLPQAREESPGKRNP